MDPTTVLQTVISAAVLSVCTSTALAGPDSGTDLLSQCQRAERFIDSGESRDPVPIATCIAFVHGVHRTLQIMSIINSNAGLMKVCMPEDGIGDERAIRIVLKFLRSNPEKLHEPKETLAVQAIAEAFQCRK